MSKLLPLVLALLLQVCVTAAQSDDDDDAPGLLERAKEAYRGLKAKLVSAGSTVADYVGMYYEDHVKDRNDSYLNWAAERVTSAWERVKTRVSSYTSD